jgi:ribonuclease HIII
LTYAILFNKKYSQDLDNQKNIKKIIVFANQSNIDLKDIDKIAIDTQKIDIFANDSNYMKYTENLFDSEMVYIGANIIEITH